LKKTLVEAGHTEEDLKAIDKEIRKRVAEAADFGESSPEPESSELYTDVLVGEY
jgi:pyruvate dehydrogenase E1 component alpha subunit